MTKEANRRPVEPFDIATIQSAIRQIGPAEKKGLVMRENIRRAMAMVDYLASRFGGAKLVVFPEFFFQGVDHKRTRDETIEICVTISGEETEMIGETAKRHGIYIAGGALEFDPDWPDRWWNSCFLIGPEGTVVQRRRELVSAPGNLTFTNPGDVYDEYVERYGETGFFPVTDTPYGRISIVTGFETTSPEVIRSLALRGAEIILECGGSPYGPHAPLWREMKHVRAAENSVFWAFANHGMYLTPVDDEQFSDSPFPAFEGGKGGYEVAPMFRSYGRSEVIDFRGKSLAIVDGPAEAMVQATADVKALRRFRETDLRRNFLAQLRPELFAPVYAGARSYPSNGLAAEPLVDRQQNAGLARQAIATLREQGIFAPYVRWPED